MRWKLVSEFSSRLLLPQFPYQKTPVNFQSSMEIIEMLILKGVILTVFLFQKIEVSTLLIFFE